ncbi:MAG: ECF-type sigma factor [Bryobacteraceae bacterium]
MENQHDITLLLQSIGRGDRAAEAQLLEAVYAELRRLAASKLRAERANHTLQPSALVNEVYLRIVNGPVTSKDRSHFFSLAASVMRNILVDHARSRKAKRRDWGTRVDLQHAGIVPSSRTDDILSLDSALAELAKLNHRHSEVVHLHFFAGLTFEEIGEALGISSRTAKRDWDMARAWLQVWMTGKSHDA